MDKVISYFTLITCTRGLLSAPVPGSLAGGRQVMGSSVTITSEHLPSPTETLYMLAVKPVRKFSP